MTEEKIVDRSRVREVFFRLTAFDAESFHEKKIASYVKEKLLQLGLTVEEDNAGLKIADKHPESSETASNLYAYLKGNAPGKPILFSAHLDTVSPGKGKKAILQEDGTITSDGTTVLGADDVSGLSAILEALSVIQEKHLDHPDLEIFITVSEEPYCEGSRFAEYERLKAKQGYVLDLDGPVGRAAIAAPSIISLKVEVEGKASHAGFAPEKGINALSIAADALSNIRTGRVYKDITVNFGTIHGGNGRNIVPERITIEGEIRGTEHENALCEAELIRQIFEKSAKKYGGSIQFTVTEHIHSYFVPENSEVVRRFLKAAKDGLQCAKPECITSYGGSDANRLNEHGIETIVLACAMEKSHSTEEYTVLYELERAAQLTLLLMTDEGL